MMAGSGRGARRRAGVPVAAAAEEELFKLVTATLRPKTGGRYHAAIEHCERLRSDEQRRLLYDMDQHLMRLRSQVGETDPAIVGLTGTYHNLLRLWADV